MSASALHGWRTDGVWTWNYRAGSNRGSDARTLCFTYKAVLHLSGKFSPLSYQNACCWREEQSSPICFSQAACVPHVGPPDVGQMMGRGHVLRGVQVESEAKGNLLCLSLSHLVDLSPLGFVTEWNVVWELEALQVSLVRKSCCGCISKLWVTWGPTRVRHAQLDLHELMSYFATFKSREHHILQKKTMEVLMG